MYFSAIVLTEYQLGIFLASGAGVRYLKEENLNESIESDGKEFIFAKK